MKVVYLIKAIRNKTSDNRYKRIDIKNEYLEVIKMFLTKQVKNSTIYLSASLAEKGFFAKQSTKSSIKSIIESKALALRKTTTTKRTAITSTTAVALGVAFMLLLLLFPVAKVQADTWNWQHNPTYHAPQYQFQSTFPYDQWGRPTSSNASPQHTQNVRRDRQAAHLPPVNGTITGFYSGEFPTGQVNPFAPQYNNNPNASRAVQVESSVFALLPGETGVNVQATGSPNGGFLASTSVAGSTSGLGNINMVVNANVHTPSPHQQSLSATQSITQQPMQSQAQPSAHLSTQPLVNITATQNNNRITIVTPFEDGTIGRITIPALNNRTASVRSGVDLPTLNNYVGHFTGTSQWDGNVSLASHNRGQGSFFADIWTLQYGDIIIYETTLGVRVYEVVSVRQISENDLSNLDHSHFNILTLVTCSAYQPALRWSIVAREID